jgi:hypothetical protein
MWDLPFLLHAKDTADNIAGIALIGQIVGNVVGLGINAKRMFTKYRKYELIESRHTAKPILWITFMMIIISICPAIWSLFEPELNALPAHNKKEPLDFASGSIITFICCCGFIAINLRFVLVDAMSARAILNILVEEIKQGRTFSLKDLESARLEIKGIADRGFVASVAIMGSALMNYLAFLAMSMVQHGSLLRFTTIALSMLAREVIATVAGLWYIAEVNDKYDEMVRMAVRLPLSFSSDITCVNTHDMKIEHSLVVQSLQGDPIGFPLFGIKLRKMNVLVQLGIWLFGVLVSSASARFHK